MISGSIACSQQFYLDLLVYVSKCRNGIFHSLVHDNLVYYLFCKFLAPMH